MAVFSQEKRHSQKITTSHHQGICSSPSLTATRSASLGQKEALPASRKNAAATRYSFHPHRSIVLESSIVSADAFHLSLRAMAPLSGRAGLCLLRQPGEPAAPHAAVAEGPHRRSRLRSAPAAASCARPGAPLQEHRRRCRNPHDAQLPSLSLCSHPRPLGGTNFRVRVERSLLRYPAPRTLRLLEAL